MAEQTPARRLEVADLERWATDPDGPVAVCLRQRLEPAQPGPRVLAPPTYADIGYNIDTLHDGTRVATVDSVGSQANRLEALFKADPGAGPEQWLVPQVDIVLREEPCGTCAACRDGGACSNPRPVTCSLLDLPHRAADAVVRCCPELREEAEQAFAALARGNAAPLCSWAPTSLLFGVWDSRGPSGVKRPRLVRSVVRAWDVDVLHSAAQYNSIWKLLGKEDQVALTAAAKGKGKLKLSEAGLADAPAVFRQVSQAAQRELREFRDGGPNPERRVLGGVLVHGEIARELTINLVALRALAGEDEAETNRIRRYLLALALLAGTMDQDLFLREGCLLRYADEDEWWEVPRRGQPQRIALAADSPALRSFVDSALEPMRQRWARRRPPRRVARFQRHMATELLARTEEPREAEES
jgi:CRISPR-associated protein Csb1